MCSSDALYQDMILIYVDILGNYMTFVSDKGPVTIIFWFISLVSKINLKFSGYQKNKTHLVFQETHNWELLMILLPIILHWGGRKPLMLKNVNYVKVLTIIIIHKLTAQLLYCTKNCDFTLFLWLSVNCRTSWISYYCSYKHNLMFQHFKEIVVVFL